MRKLTKSALLLIFLALSACGTSVIQGGAVAPNDFAYLGDQVAGQSYVATHIEMGIGSGIWREIRLGNLEVHFDLSANFISGNKNCNAFEANIIWYDYSVAFQFSLAENNLCSVDFFAFPESVYLDDIFEMDVYFDNGVQVMVLYSENQDVAIYFEWM
jgi:hypothetical protein